MSQDNIPLYQDMFNQIDYDRGGMITYAEFKGFFIQREPFLSTKREDILHMLFFLMNKNGDKKITFQEFIPFARACTMADISYSGNLQFIIFKTLDADNSGYVTPAELKRMVEMWGRSGDYESLKQNLAALDYDGDGKLTYEEFVRIWPN